MILNTNILMEMNVLAFKIMHHMKLKRKAQKGYMTLKLEQRVMIEWEWLFVGNIMKRIVFHTKWIELINGRSHQSFLLYIKKQRAKVSYSVLKNREPKGFIKSSWGPVKGSSITISFVFLIRCRTPNKV